MDDLDRAIFISFSHSVDASLKSQAVTFCEQAKQSPTIVQACVERLRSSQFDEVRFWCLQTFEELIKHRYASLTSELRLLIRSELMAAADTYQQNRWQPFTKNKLAQVIVLLLCIEYPLEWPSVFVELLSSLNKGPASVDMFCRVLSALDEDVISLDIPRKPEETALAAKIKDAMRLQCISQIAAAWYNLVMGYKEAKPELAAVVLQTMSKYVSWIDIGLVANGSFIPLLFDILVSPQEPLLLRGAAADCLHAIISKRMDASSKLSLLQQLNIGSVCARIGQVNDVELASKFSALLTGFAAEVLECSRKSMAVNVSNMLEEVLPSVFFFVQHEDEDVSSQTLQFLSNYVNRMKSTAINGKEAVHIGHILEVIRYKMRYKPEYKEALDIFDREGQEEEDRVDEYRKELFALFRSIYRVTPSVTEAFVKNVLASILSNPDTPFEDVEAGITLLYKLGEGVNDDALKNDAGNLCEMLGALLTMTFPCSSHRVVALAYLETIIRYVKFLQYHDAYIPSALTSFLDSRGIHHPNSLVSSRTAYLFVKLVKVLRPQLLAFVDIIIQNLQDVICIPIEKEKEGSDYRSHIFEAIGLIVGAEDLSSEKQENLLSAVLLPLIAQVDALIGSKPSGDRSANVNVLQQTVLAITYLSKGFKEVHSRPPVGNILKQSVDVIVRILLAYPEEEALRSKVISFLHRMVDVLGTSVFPVLPTVIQQLLSHSEPKDLVEFIQLLNQLINKFKTSMNAILQEIFPSVYDRCFALLPKGLLPADLLSNTEVYRELHELQRIFFNFIHALVSNNLSSVLLVQSRERLNHLFQLLLTSSCSHKDILARKVCVQALTRLASDWCGNATVSEKVPGFNRFMIDSFAAECCIRSTLDNSFNLNDANTVSLMAEMASAQKALYDKCGEEFLMQMATAVLPAFRCPPSLAQEYCILFQMTDAKLLKPHFRGFVAKLRAVR